MPQIETTVWFEVYCGECGEGICHLTRVVNCEEIRVRPCNKCLEKKYYEGVRSQEEVVVLEELIEALKDRLEEALSKNGGKK